jgi:hypothetical protein
MGVSVERELKSVSSEMKQSILPLLIRLSSAVVVAVL